MPRINRSFLLPSFTFGKASRIAKGRQQGRLLRFGFHRFIQPTRQLSFFEFSNVCKFELKPAQSNINMKQEKYSRYEFLKKMGFQGGALMAVLASCTQQEDSVLESLIVNKNGETVAALDSTKTSAAVSTPSTSTGGTTNGGTTTGGSTSSTSMPLGKVSTAELSNVKSPLVKLDLSISSSAALANTGGYITVNNAIVIGRTASGDFVAASNLCTHEPKRRVIFNKTEYFCTDHGARFSLTGANLNTVARSPLTVYKTANDGKTLIVYA